VQLHRKLRAILDQPAGDFVRVIRLNKSIELLKTKSGNISEIAYDVGFSSPSYFSECFRRHFGLSPTEYQSQNTKN
ncbi:MAG: helix-turn-helix transcriptional regulator, partial [Bacteroidales bacterium]|nr:helix-turn-helix transcriptional regulator [Bacteroidales bacterium]